MKPFCSLCICCLALLFFPIPLLATEQDEKDIEAFEKMFPPDKPSEEDFWRADELLISATGSLKPVRLAPSVASVITKEEIEQMGATTLEDVLETVAGVHTLPSGLNIFSSIWSIRGIHTKFNPQVLLLINGVAFTRPYYGGRPNTFRMPVSMISRVEVIRGPGSAVHGADAFAGVINVITKDNFEIDGTEVGLRYGSFDTVDAWLMHGGQSMGWDYWASLETQQSEGDKDRVVDRDYMHSIGAAALSQAPGYLDTSYNNTQSVIGLRKDDFTLNFYGFWSKDNAMGPSAQQIVDYNNKVNVTDLLLNMEYSADDLAENWKLDFRLYGAYLKQDNYFQLFPKSFLNMIGNPITTTKYGGLEATGIYEGWNNHILRLSAGMKYIDTDTEQYNNFKSGQSAPYPDELEYMGPDSPEIYMTPQTRSIWFASIQDEWQIIKHWTFTGGARLDEYSDFGTTINPRAALVWETRYDLTTKLLYGRAFRTPSFSEQYLQNNPQITGNENLNPETINTIELAFEYVPTVDLTTKLNFFYYQAEDLVEYVGSLPAPAENYGEQEGKGVELELEYRFKDNLRIQSNFAYQRSINKNTDTVVHDAPEYQFYLNPSWTFLPDWSLDGQFYWIGGRHRQAADPRDDIDDYTKINLTLRKKNIIKNFDLALAVRNLFDEDIREPSPYDPSAPLGAHMPDDYPMEGRAIWVELRARF